MLNSPRATDRLTPPSGNLPRHIAIIMDGNGRWARRRSLPRLMGHREGVRAVREAVTTCAELKLEALTLYAFSTENWRRPPREISGLMRLLRNYLVREVEEMVENDIRLVSMGRLEQLPATVRKALERAMAMTANCRGMRLNLALSYSGRTELTDGMRRLAREVQQGRLQPQEITEELIGRYLYIDNLPEPDLVIRTSGEERISNFMIWQIAYAELCFLDIAWPDFRKQHLYAAIREFQQRDRRFGMVPEELRERAG
jgi:undecaprenyl diphosphate synthase